MCPKLLELEKTGAVALSLPPIDPSKLKFVGVKRYNRTGRVERGVFHDADLLRHILSDNSLRRVIEFYLGTPNVCVLCMCAVSCSNDKAPTQEPHRDVTDDHGKFLTLALPTCNRPVATRFVPCTHRHRDKYSAMGTGVFDTYTKKGIAVANGCENCAMYDPCMIHYGTEGVSEWRLFVTFTELTNIDDVQSNVASLTGFSKFSDSYGNSNSCNWYPYTFEELFPSAQYEQDTYSSSVTSDTDDEEYYDLGNVGNAMPVVRATYNDVNLGIFIINIKERRDRRRFMDTRLASCKRGLPSGISLHVQYIDAITVDTLNREDFTTFSSWKMNPVQTSVKHWKRKVTPPEIACTCSHLKAMKAVQLFMSEKEDEKRNFALILEDDAYISTESLLGVINDAQHLEKVQDDWDLLYAGWSSNNTLCEDQALPVPLSEFVYGTFAICYHRRAISKILENVQFLYNNMVAFDEMIPALTGLHSRNDMQVFYTTCACVAYRSPWQRILHHKVGKSSIGAS